MLLDKDCKVFQVSSNDFSEFLGIVISILSISITVYFAIMAISAYGKIQEIDNTYKSIQQKATECNNSHQSINNVVSNITNLEQECLDSCANMKDIHAQMLSISKNYVSSIFLLYDNIIIMAEINKNDKLRKEIKKMRSRLLYSNFDIDDNTKINLLYEISSIGEPLDIEHLDKIRSSNNESNKVKMIVDIVIKNIKHKYNLS